MGRTPAKSVTEPCPICDFAQTEVRRTGITGWDIHCLGCGDIELRGFLDSNWGQNGIQIPQALRPTRHLVAAAAAERRVRKQGRLTVTPENWGLITANSPQTLPEQVDRFLSNLAAASSEPGMMTSLSSAKDCPLAYAAAKDSLVFRLETLQDMGLIQFRGKREDKLNDMGFRLTYAGWQRAHDFDRGTLAREQVFVAMTLDPARTGDDDPSLIAVKDALVEGIRHAGYRPLFMGDLVHGDRIDDRILVELRRSRLVVVDTTGHNANVVFEAGFALGLNRQVLWTCRDGDHKDQGLDFRQYKRILWQTGQEAKLREELANAIEVVIGEGPLQAKAST